MYGDVWKWAGEFRRTENNIGISWHQSNTVKANETRKEYINPLRETVNDNFTPLIEFSKN